MVRIRLLQIPSGRRYVRRRITYLAIILVLYSIYYIFFKGPVDLPNEIYGSSIYHPADSSRDETFGLAYGDDGMVKGWDTAHDLLETRGILPKWAKKRIREIRDRHPIEELMERGKARWELILARQSRTLPQAVTEYVRRYNRKPPKGFEVWWQFCKKHGVRIVDEYDQINRDISPYLALSPAEFQARAAKLDHQQHSYQISLSPSSTPTLTGLRAHSPRGILLFNLLAPLSKLMPDPIKITVSDHDLGDQMIGDDQYRIASRAIQQKRYMTKAELRLFEDVEARGEAKGMMSACAKGSLGWNVTVAKQRGEVILDPLAETTFIHNPRPTYDLCTNPSIMKVHGSHSHDSPRESILRPLFQSSKFARDPSFLMTPLKAYENHTSSTASSEYSPWSEKTVNQLFWRGKTTGDFHTKRKEYNWRDSHRIRLHYLANPGLSGAGRGADEKVGIWVKKGRQWVWEIWSKDQVSNYYMDIGLTGKPHQCSIEDGTCAEMEAEIDFKDYVGPERYIKYKYVLDVDGNGWSSRFHRLLNSGALVIKATIYPEWQSDILIPWYHYVPTQIDYSDLFNILSFFIGPPNGRKGVGGNDHLAQRIAEQGRQFGIEHWRWEDMQAYMLRLLLEYNRLMADDREAASYQKIYA